MIVLKVSDFTVDNTNVLGLFYYIQACCFLGLNSLSNLYVRKTAHRPDLAPQFHHTCHNGAFVAVILKKMVLTEQFPQICCLTHLSSVSRVSPGR